MKHAQTTLFGYASESFSLAGYLNSFSFPTSGLYKCRLLYGITPANPEFISYQKRRIETLKVVHCDTIDYHLKFTNRSFINNLYDGRNDFDDVLIVRNGMITDTSFCNIVFSNGKDWYTPENPLLEGVRRESLINNSIIRRKKIDLGMLDKFETFKLVNAMIPWQEAEEISVRNIFTDTNPS
jgi:4-amino-4-deoxychorismate lyase